MADAGPEASGETGAGSKPESESGAGSKPGSESTGVYTQEQVDRFVAEAKRREVARFGDYDAVKAKLAELEAKDKTDLERAQTAAQEAETRATTATEQRNRLLVRSAVTAAAARAGALDPDVVVALIAEGITVDSSGEIGGDVDKLVAELLESKPFLKNGSGTASHGSADGGAHGRASTAGAHTGSGSMDDLLRKNR